MGGARLSRTAGCRSQREGKGGRGGSKRGLRTNTNTNTVGTRAKRRALTRALNYTSGSLRRSLCFQPSAVPRSAATAPPLRLLSNCHSRCLCLAARNTLVRERQQAISGDSASVSIPIGGATAVAPSQPTPISQYMTRPSPDPHLQYGVV
jgi:hypothetical protein